MATKKPATKKSGNTKNRPAAPIPSKPANGNGSNSGFASEPVAVADLKPHPRNYRIHPPDQITHLIQSLKEHGVYRNVVIAEDNTILAGHGVVEAATQMGWTQIPCIRLPIDPESTAALKVLAGDNGLGHLAEQDDRLFTELLKNIRDEDPFGLLGTGYDDNMLAGLLFITRPESEIKDADEAAHWVGMPDYEEGESKLRISIFFRSESDREQFLNTHKLKICTHDNPKSWSTWWPYKEHDDLASVRFEQQA